MYVLVSKVVRGIFVAGFYICGIACCVTHFNVLIFYRLSILDDNYSSVQECDATGDATCTSAKYKKLTIDNEQLTTIGICQPAAFNRQLATVSCQLSLVN